MATTEKKKNIFNTLLSLLSTSKDNTTTTKTRRGQNDDVWGDIDDNEDDLITEFQKKNEEVYDHYHRTNAPTSSEG